MKRGFYHAFFIAHNTKRAVTLDNDRPQIFLGQLHNILTVKLLLQPYFVYFLLNIM